METPASAPSSTSSDIWSCTAETTTEVTVPSGSPPLEGREKPLHLKFEAVGCVIFVTNRDLPALSHQREDFLKELIAERGNDDTQPKSPIALALRFIQYLFDNQTPRDVLRPILQSFHRQFICSEDAHTILSSLPDSLGGRKRAIKTYYAAWATSLRSLEATDSALCKAAGHGQAKMFAVFGGQGDNNLSCFSDLRELNFLYGPFIKDLLDEADRTLRYLSQLPETQKFYKHRPFELYAWLSDPEIAPGRDILAQAAFSFPIIGLISLARYCVTCKILNKSPGDFRSLLKGVTGLSQGLIVAVVIACSEDWRSFCQNANSAIELLFWIGYQCHNLTTRLSIPASAIADSLDHNEGQPSSLLSVQGLSEGHLQKAVENANDILNEADKVYIGLANTPHKFVAAGPAKSLCGLNLYLRSIKADMDADQTRIPFDRRKPVIKHRFLPVSAPFHTPHLQPAVSKIMASASQVYINQRESKSVPVYHTQTGDDISELKGKDLLISLVTAVTVCYHDARAAFKFPDATHVIVFDRSVASLVAQNKDGQGVRTISASDIEAPKQGIGSQAEIFARTLPDTVMRPMAWGSRFKPHLISVKDAQWHMETRFSMLLGLPPVMVAGMTPTTVHWDFVSAIMNAGYHAELAGGGYVNAKSMSAALRSLASSIPPGRGITCNLIYVSPKAMTWQIPMLGQLIREGVPIDGLTIGAGIPSAEIAADYVASLGLKHISFKPGSLSAIKQVLTIAQAHPNLPVILQWTGGRGGGHHSFEDFHEPLLQTYSEIRQCSNLILVVGSGFGDGDGTYPYLTGDWAHAFGRPSMPVDGILLGSRMMVAKEAHTSLQTKKLIIGASGSQSWEKSYSGEVGGVMTVQSEMGQPIHKVATRGVRLWAKLDKMIFKLPREKRVAELRKHRDWIIQELHDDFAKPWFGRNCSGKLVDLDDLTYAEVIARLIELMYVKHQGRWVDGSYSHFVFDFAWRTAERLHCSEKPNLTNLREDPFSFLQDFVAACPLAETDQIHPEDVTYFVILCKRRDQKPVNFVPALDDNFEFWFKKDSLWQSEDIDAVADQDAGRVCILQGPVAAQFSARDDESAKSILDGVCNRHIETMRKDYTVMNGPESLLSMETSEKMLAASVAPLPNRKQLHGLPPRTPDWVEALLAPDFVLQGGQRVTNPFRVLFNLGDKDLISEEEHSLEVRLTGKAGMKNDTLACIRRDKASDIFVELFYNTDDGRQPSILSFHFSFTHELGLAYLIEDMPNRTDRIRAFYSKLWLSTNPSETDGLDSTFQGPRITLTRDTLKQFLSTVGKGYSNAEMLDSTSDIFPMDFLIVLAWDVLMRPLFVKDFDGDLLRLVHRSNTFEYLPGATPLRVGDQVDSKSRVEAVTIEPAGISMTVKASVQRFSETVAAVTSTFICIGSSTDCGSAFKLIEEPEMTLHVSTPTDEALLRDRDWLILDAPSLALVGKHLLFRLQTHTNYSKSGAIAQISTTGSLFEISIHRQRSKIGRVDFAAYACQGNPVMDFLSRKGEQAALRVDLKNPGWDGQASIEITMPASNEEYARVSGDRNPIHVSPIFADWAGLPGTISHGMLTSAISRSALEHLIGDGSRLRFRKWSTSFVGMVMPSEQLKLSFQHTAMVHGRMVLQFTVRKQETDAKVLEGEAEIEQERTAYVFTGQGSQEEGMGKALYESSPAARKVWDEADHIFQHTYGWSIKDIVWNNPKRLIVRFGGHRGRQVRDNYLEMRIDETTSEGHTISQPVLKSLDRHSESYTFSDSQGLVFSTQFAQPAIVIHELAAFEDMRSRGLIQEDAIFAGHSLGEYASLAALASFLPMNRLMKLLFYRGLAMQVAMERDEQGRTGYAMVAVSPSRVGKFYHEDALKWTVEMISKESDNLLEIVNFNIEGEQYVCAGHLRTITSLTSLLNELATHASLPSQLDLQSLITKHVSAARTIPMPIVAERGVATIPLTGIDVPFHSTHLRQNVQAYRKYLRQQLSKDDVVMERLVGKYVPNLTAKAFDVGGDCLQEARRLTGSDVLERLVEGVTL